MNRLMTVLATAMLVVPGGAAMAETAPAPQTAGFDYSDLDLASHDGQVRLATRLADAADTVCGGGFKRVHPSLDQQAALCKAEAIAEARGRIDRRLAARGGAVRTAQAGTTGPASH